MYADAVTRAFTAWADRLPGARLVAGTLYPHNQGLYVAFAAAFAALPPGEEKLFTMALDLVPDLKVITEEQLKELKALALKLDPIFTNQA